MIHSVEKNLAEHGDKIGEEDKKGIEAAIAELRTALEGDDLEDIKAKTEALTQASMKLGEEIYKASQADAEGGATDAQQADAAAKAAEADEGDDVVDVDFEEVDENDKK